MNPDLEKIVAGLRPLCQAADSVTELACRATIEGPGGPDVEALLLGLLDACEASGLERLVTVTIQDVTTDAAELRDQIEHGIPVRAWRVSVYKEGMMPAHPRFRTILFLSAAEFFRWATEIDAFCVNDEWGAPGGAVRILVDGIKLSFGGPRLAVAEVTADGIPDDWPRAWCGPNDEDIKKQVHLLTDKATIVDPGRFLLDWGAIDLPGAAPFRALGAQTLATSLVQVSYRNNRVLLKGAKMLEVPLYDEARDAPNAGDLGRLRIAVEWVYQERPEIRAELIADRLSLDLQAGESLVHGACRLMDDALAQAKERYRFVIAEKKEAWVKELREVLKDVQGQSQLYSDKLRSIMNSLLRDVLAALLLISLGLFARIGRSQDILGSHEAEVLFRALSLYLVASIVLQAFVHLRDVLTSDSEVRRWAKQTRTHLGQDVLRTQLEEPLNDRWREFLVTGTVLASVYVLLAGSAWFFQPLMSALGLLGP
jgi:hypothetical protein